MPAPLIDRFIKISFGLGLLAAAGCQQRPRDPEQQPAPAAEARAGAAARAQQTKVVRFTIAPPDGTELASPAWTFHSLSVSPDGRQLALSARAEKQAELALWIRALDTLAARPVAGSEGALSPFWAPDSRRVGFFAGGKLKTVKAGGGKVTTICDVPPGAGSGTWNAEGTILFAGGGRAANPSDIYRVAEAGGSPEALTERQPGAHLWPQFLPDGRRFLHLQQSAGKPATVTAAALDSDERRSLIEVDSLAVPAQGHLIYVRAGTLLAHPFDDRQLRFTGEPFPLAQRLTHFAPAGHARFAVSEGGVLVYGDGEDLARLTWFTRRGEPGEALGSPAGFRDVRLSPDGRQLLAAIVDRRTGTTDLWVQDLARRTSLHVTTDPGDERSPVFAPDGQRIAFGAGGGSAPALAIKALPGDSPARAVGPPGRPPVADGDPEPSDWSPDGRHLLYVRTDRRTGDQDIWLAPVDGSAEALPWRKTPSREREARFSPDGRSVAYVSEESGRPEVYLRPLQGDGEARAVSAGGGAKPRWRRDGKELYFLAPDGTLMAAAIAARAGGGRVEAGRPAALFKTAAPERPGYEVSADGQRFLVGAAASKISSTPLIVVVNWIALVQPPR